MVSKRWLEEAELHCAAAQSLQEEKEASRSQAIAHGCWERWDFSGFFDPEAAEKIVSALTGDPPNQELEDLVRFLVVGGYADDHIDTEVTVEIRRIVRDAMHKMMESPDEYDPGVWSEEVALHCAAAQSQAIADRANSAKEKK